MDSKQIIKWVLIAGAAYLVYKYLVDNGYLGSGTTALPAGTTDGTAAATTTPATTSSTTPATTTSVVPASGAASTGASSSTTTTTSPAAAAATATSGTVSVPSTKDLVAQMAAGDAFFVNGRATIDHWNYYYNQTPAGKSKPAPDPATMAVDRNAALSVDEWWSLMQQAGMSGVIPSWYATPSVWRN